jgi:hypothetical protein
MTCVCETMEKVFDREIAFRPGNQGLHGMRERATLVAIKIRIWAKSSRVLKALLFSFELSGKRRHEGGREFER